MATSASAPIKFTGEDLSAWMKSSLQVFTDLGNPGGTPQYVGKTKAEKQFSPGYTNAEWWDNTSGVQTLYIIDPAKVDMKLAFSFSQVIDENVLALFVNADIDRTIDPNHNIVNMGSNPGPFRSGKWLFTGIGRTGRIVTLTVLRGAIVPTGSLALGAPGAFAEAAMELRFLQDTTQVNTTKDLGYWSVQKVTS